MKHVSWFLFCKPSMTVPTGIRPSSSIQEKYWLQEYIGEANVHCQITSILNDKRKEKWEIKNEPRNLEKPDCHWHLASVSCSKNQHGVTQSAAHVLFKFRARRSHEGVFKSSLSKPVEESAHSSSFSTMTDLDESCGLVSLVSVSRCSRGVCFFSFELQPMLSVNSVWLPSSVHESGAVAWFLTVHAPKLSICTLDGSSEQMLSSLELGPALVLQAADWCRILTWEEWLVFEVEALLQILVLVSAAAAAVSFGKELMLISLFPSSAINIFCTLYRWWSSCTCHIQQIDDCLDNQSYK